MKKIKKNLGQPKNGVSQIHCEADKEKVATTGASFTVKYLGYEEVKEARGVKVCSNAVAKLIKDKKNKKKMSLKISLDGVRVVDDISRVLILDQPIEKISFCAPDSAHPKLFSYIARDGASRRWLCYGFYAVDDPGERLSHALGCAFTACLQRKQKATKAHEAANSNSSIGSSKDSSPATTKGKSTPPRPPITKANTSGCITTIKKLPPKEITVPLPNRDRSATTIGISTPPTQSAAQSRTSNPFGDNFEPAFTADLADILLFDPNDEGEVIEQRKRAATELPLTNLIDEFDPLHPNFKNMNFEDDFRPPPLQHFHSTIGSGYHSSAAAVSQFSTTNPFSDVSDQSLQKTGSTDDFDLFASSRINQR